MGLLHGSCFQSPSPGGDDPVQTYVDRPRVRTMKVS
jgi:hypothetical protein